MSAWERNWHTDGARLAAAAPLMARALLDIDNSVRCGRACPWCSSCATHAPDCQLDAALRAAGVRKP